MAILEKVDSTSFKSFSESIFVEFCGLEMMSWLVYSSWCAEWLSDNICEGFGGSFESLWDHFCVIE